MMGGGRLIVDYSLDAPGSLRERTWSLASAPVARDGGPCAVDERMGRASAIPDEGAAEGTRGSRS